MNAQLKARTLRSLTTAVETAASRCNTAKISGDLGFVEAKAEFNKAREDLRVFCYKAKSALTRSGHAIRH